MRSARAVVTKSKYVLRTGPDATGSHGSPRIALLVALLHRSVRGRASRPRPARKSFGKKKGRARRPRRVCPAGSACIRHRCPSPAKTPRMMRVRYCVLLTGRQAGRHRDPRICGMRRTGPDARTGSHDFFLSREINRTV